MKKIVAVIFCLLIFTCGCSQNENTNVHNQDLQNENVSQSDAVKVLQKGDSFSITGTVDYSDEPSDIGQEYCFVETDNKIEYYYKDIYDKTSNWSSDVFYTKGEDTKILKNYVGKSVTVSGEFDVESHGIPYITNISIK